MTTPIGSMPHELPELVANPRPEIYSTGEFVVLDFETTAIEVGSPYNMQNQLLLACWWTSWDEKFHWCFGGEYEQQELLKDLKRADFIVAQNAKFELGWLDRCGIDLHDVLVFDTMLAEWVLHGNLKLPKNLGSMLERRGLKGKEDVVAGMIELGIDPINIPKPLLLTYCLEDVRGTLELFLDQLMDLEDRQQLHLVYSRCLLTPVLVDIEKTGVTLDKDEVIKEWYKVSQEHEQAKGRLQAFGPEINFDSPQQVAKLLYSKEEGCLGFEEVKDFRGNPIRTDSGAPSTSADVISRLRAGNRAQAEFVSAYREFSDSGAKLSKTLNFFKEVVENHDCTFYGIINQGNTGTHRLSSSGRPIERKVAETGTAKDYQRLSAQLQNMPREYKRLVVPKRKGWEIVDADGSQIEFRVAADMGHDKVALDEIAAYADIHSITAKALSDAGEPTSRQCAKPRTFRPLYGGTSGTPAEQEYCKFFQKKYEGIFAEQTKWTHAVLAKKELRTPYGLIFYWPDTRVTRSGFITNTTAIFNYPVQGFATAEIIPIVLISLWHRLRGWDVRFILTIHDNITLEIGPNVDRELLKKVIAEAFTADVYDYLEKCYGYTFEVPLGCGIKIGERWGSGTEIQAQMFNHDRKLIWRQK